MIDGKNNQFFFKWMYFDKILDFRSSPDEQKALRK
jgi:hypothetical protein